MGKARTRTTSIFSNLKPQDVSVPEVKTYGLSSGFVTKTHSDLRRDPKFQDESEKLLNYLSEQEGAAEAITGGLISNDIFETLRDEEGRLLTVADRARVLKDAPEDIKQTYAYLRNEFENSKPGSFGEVGKALFDRGVDLFADPINLALALVAPGVGSTATKASAGALNKALTSEAGKQSVKRTLNNISASKVGAATAFEGAAWTGVENANRQDINITTGIQDAFSTGQFGLAVGIGGAFGGALGYGGTKLFSRRTPSVAETPPSTTKPIPLVDEASPIEKLDFSNIDTSQPLVINYNRLQNIDGTPTTVTKQTEVIFEPTGKTRANGTPVYATTKTRKGEIQSVVLDDKAIRESFKNKPWTTSRVRGVSPLKADDIQTEDEWVMFNLLHELDHVVNPKPQVMKKALFENRANEKALEQLKIARETNVLPEILTNAHQKVKDTVSNFFDGITTSTTRRGQEYFDRNLNPEVDTNLLNKLGKSLNNKYDDTRVASIILGIKDTIFKRLTPQQKSRGLDIATKSRIMEVNDVNPDVLAKFKEYGLTESEIDIAIREVRETYLKDGEKTATGVLESGQKVKVSQRLDLTDEDIGILARGLSNNVGGGQRTSDVLADNIAEINATQGISNSVREKTILSKSLNIASKFNSKYLTGKVAGVLDPYVGQAPNVIGALQKRVTSSLSNSWKRGESIVRNTNDYATVFDREFGRLALPFKAVYEPVLKLAKGELRDNIDTLLSNAIRTGSTKKLGEATSHLDKEVRKSLLDIVTFSRTQLNELGTELQGRGFVNNLVDNYLPRLWKRSEIENNKEDFINLLEKNVSFSGDARKGAEELYEELLDIKYQFGNDAGTGMNSFFAQRALVLKDETAFNKYLDNDLNNVMVSYYRSAAKSFAKDDVFNVRNIEEFKSTWFPAIEKEMRENGADSASIQSARNDMLSVYQSITGEDLDRFGPMAQKFADGYMLFNRMALLPLSTLSSLTEIFINISKAGPKKAFAGMRDAVFSGSKKMYDDSLNGLEKSFNMTRKEAMEELNYMGIALDQAFADYADRLGGDALASPLARKVSNKFFRLTLLDQWTRGVQTASYITGKRLIAENLESIASHMPLIQAGKTSRRVQRQIDELADLGINYNEGVAWLQQGAKTGDNFYTKLKEGAGVYTNEVILNPSAQSGIKPMYMSNPKTAILGQLLGYPAAFTNTIMKNVIREGTRNPETILTHHLPAAAIMTGIAAFTNAVRTQGESLKGDPEEIIGNAFLRWGGNGLPADMFVRGRTAAEIYQNPSAYMTGLGPVWGDTYKVITTGDIFSVVGQKVPGYGAFNAVFGSFESTEDLPDQYRDFLRELDKNIVDELDIVPERKATPKRNFRKGGEVYNVMQVPIEPDERIDKMTGLAYDIQAGGAFIDEEDRQSFALGALASKAAPVLRSKLTEVLTKLANKGENIPVNRLVKKLETQGVRKDEIKAAGIAKDGTTANKIDTVVTQSGNIAYSPDSLKTIDRTRRDKPLVDSEFETAKETYADRYYEEPYSEEFGEGGGYIEIDDPIFPYLYEKVVPEDVLPNTYEIKVFGDPRVPSKLISPHFERINLNPNNPAAQVSEANPVSYWVRFDEINKMKEYGPDHDGMSPQMIALRKRIFPKLGPDRLRVFEMQSDLIVNEKTLSNIKRTIREKLGDDDLVPVLEKNFGIDKKNISFTKEEAKALKDDASKTIEVEDKVNKIYQIIAESGNYSPGPSGNNARDDLGNLNDMYLLKNFFENEYIEEYVSGLQDFKKRNKTFLKENLKLNSAINKYIELKDDIQEAILSNDKIQKLVGATTRNIINTSPIAKLDVSQNIINRMISETKKRGHDKVSFLIGKDTPTSKEYLTKLKRSKPIQDYYETVVAKQIYKIAKKIGATTSWDQEGYLTINLPEKEFTLPMYKNKGGYISREEYSIGGKVKKVLDKIMYAGSARMGVTQEDLRNHEKEVVTFLNEAIERGEIPKQFKVPTDEAGFGDFRKPFNDEVWNVMNHAYLSYKHGKSAGNKFLLQLKEQVQMPFRPDPRTEATDMVNNAYGFGLQNIAKDDLDAQRIMIKDYDITQEKLKAGKPLMYGVDPLYNPKETKLVRTRSLMDTKYGRTGL